MNLINADSFNVSGLDMDATATEYVRLPEFYTPDNTVLESVNSKIAVKT